MSGVNINNLAYTSTDFKDADLIEVYRSSDSKNTQATGATVKAAALATVVAAAPWASASNTKTIKTATADYVILDADGYYLFLGDTTTAAKRITFTLPTLADNLGRTMEVKVIGAGGILVAGEGAETISGLASIPLYSDGDHLEIIGTTTEWKILSLRSRLTTGAVNTADWTNRHLGSRNLAYDNLTVSTFVIGELVSEYSDSGYTTPTGKTGRIMSDSGTVLVLRDVSGGGTFTNNYYLVGASSGAKAYVNQPTAIKDQDSGVYHGFGVSYIKLKFDFVVWAGTSGGTESQLIRPYNSVYISSDSGLSIIGVDANSFTVQTSNGGIIYNRDSDGLSIGITTSDYCYQIFVEFFV